MYSNSHVLGNVFQTRVEHVDVFFEDFLRVKSFLLVAFDSGRVTEVGEGRFVNLNVTASSGVEIC